MILVDLVVEVVTTPKLLDILDSHAGLKMGDIVKCTMMDETYMYIKSTPDSEPEAWSRDRFKVLEGLTQLEKIIYNIE